MENPTAKPLIYTTPLPQKSKEVASGIKNNLPRIIFLLLGVIILVEIIIGVRTILSTDSLADVPQIQTLQGGTLALVSEKNYFSPDEKFTVSAKIATGGQQTDSTDLVIYYNPNQLETSSSDITVGDVYLDYPIADVDRELGLIRISGITPPNEEGFNGVGEFASIDFTPLTEGRGELRIEFEKGSTTDSNIVASEAPQDLLENAVNFGYEIGSNSAGTERAQNSCTGYLQQCQNTEGMAGSQYCSAGIVREGACVFDPKLTTSCDVCKIN